MGKRLILVLAFACSAVMPVCVPRVEFPDISEEFEERFGGDPPNDAFSLEPDYTDFPVQTLETDTS